jgi:hypothetical protein
MSYLFEMAATCPPYLEKLMLALALAEWGLIGWWFAL